MTRALLTATLTAVLGVTAARADLFAAIADRDTVRVSRLLVHGADVDTVDANGNTPLMLAAACAYDDVAGLLVAAGADVNATGRIGNTPLIYAIEAGAEAISRTLIDAGARVDAANDFGTTPRSLAVGYGHREIVAILDAARAPASDIALAF